MKIIFLIPLFFTLPACIQNTKKSSPRKVAQFNSQNSNEETLRQRFLHESGMALGEYLLEGEPSPLCLEGDVEVIEVDGEKISILIGGRLLISGIKSSRFNEKSSERDCVYLKSTKWQTNRVSFKTSRKCKETIVRSRTSLEILGAEIIEYKIITSENGVVTAQTSCRLLRQR